MHACVSPRVAAATARVLARTQQCNKGTQHRHTIRALPNSPASQLPHLSVERDTPLPRLLCQQHGRLVLQVGKEQSGGGRGRCGYAASSIQAPPYQIPTHKRTPHLCPPSHPPPLHPPPPHHPPHPTPCHLLQAVGQAQQRVEDGRGAGGVRQRRGVCGQQHRHRAAHAVALRRAGGAVRRGAVSTGWYWCAGRVDDTDFPLGAALANQPQATSRTIRASARSRNMKPPWSMRRCRGPVYDGACAGAACPAAAAAPGCPAAMPPAAPPSPAPPSAPAPAPAPPAPTRPSSCVACAPS